MRYFIQFALLLLLIQGAFAESIEIKDFENSSQESRYLDLIDNIRCPVCQGQSIGGSNSGLAKALREQVRKMILNDKSDDDVYLFMIERYGDFVIFKPPINWKTYLLWFTPLIFLVLFMVEPIVTALLLIITSIFYFGIYKKITKHAKVLGEIGPVYSSKAFKLIDLAFNSIKEIKIRNNGNYYLNLFHPIAKLYTNAQTNIQLYLFFPIGLLEVFTFGIALIIIMYLLANNENFLSTIPIIGLYAISLKRILPAINNIYQQVTAYQYFKPSFNLIYEDLLESRKKEYSYLGEQKDKFFFKK